MIYKITQNFQRLPCTFGTIQNTSSCYVVEISDTDTADSSIILYPRQKISFSGVTLYARCKGMGGAELRVVSFMLDFGTAGNSSTDTQTDTATDDDADAIINDGLNHLYTAPDDVNAVIDKMLNNTDPIDTGDGFSDFVNELFP